MGDFRNYKDNEGNLIIEMNEYVAWTTTDSLGNTYIVMGTPGSSLTRTIVTPPHTEYNGVKPDTTIHPYGQ